MPFDQFPEKLRAPGPSNVKGAPSKGRDRVDPTLPAFASFVVQYQVPLAFETMQDRIHRAGTDLGNRGGSIPR